jgi:DNA-binding MarR family transcriptional regulator
MKLDLVKPQTQILLVLVDRERRFKEIVKGTGLSEPTVSKWLKILSLMGFVEKKKNQYRITENGLKYLRQVFTDLVNKAFEYGLVEKVKIYPSSDAEVIMDEGEVAIVIEAYPERDGEPARVIMSMGDKTNVREFIENISKRLSILE